MKKSLNLTFSDLDKEKKRAIISIRKSKKVKDKLSNIFREVIQLRISDSVAKYILDLINEADGTAEIQRNELANVLGCVPSQINYVITSRFTPEQGYIVESRRGGGGYIRITRRQLSKSDVVMHIVNSVGDSLDGRTAKAMAENMEQNQVISHEASALIQSAVSDQTLSGIPREYRNGIRASIFKSMLLVTQ